MFLAMSSDGPCRLNSVYLPLTATMTCRIAGNLMETPLAELFRPNNVLALGLAFHVAQDEPSRSTKDGRLSSAMLADLAKLTAAPADAAYLLSVKGIVVTLGDGLTSLAVRQRADFAAAEDWRKVTSSRIKETHDQVFWSNLLSRVIMFGGIGFALLSSIAPMIHMEHHEAQQSSLSLGVIGAIVFAAGSRVVAMKMANWQDEAMMRQYEWLRTHAMRKYLTSRHELIKTCHDQAASLWKACTGKNCPDMVSLLAIAAEEKRAHENEIRERKKVTTTMLHSMFEKLSAWRRKHHPSVTETMRMSVSRMDIQMPTKKEKETVDV